MKESIRLEPLEHRGANHIAVRGRLGPGAEAVIRRYPGRMFSKTHSCWYVPYSQKALDDLTSRLTGVQPVSVAQFGNEEKSAAPVMIDRFPLPDGYHEQLVLVRYSEQTIKTYESQLRQFIAWLRPKQLEDIDEPNIKRYLFYLANNRKVSISTQNTAINSIKFYLEKVQRGERKEYYVDRPMKEEKLPHVLTQEEVGALISVTKNVKHKCMLLVLYSTGIRMSELLRVRWSDFDQEKLQLFVRGGKGRKDRLTITAERTLTYTRFYLKLYEPREYLFEGPDGGAYSPRSVNQIIHRSAKLAGITKKVSAHTLRHSFATHLLEENLDIRYIQILMGHQSSKTTERYTHMTTKGFRGIKSPLDRLAVKFDFPSENTE